LGFTVDSDGFESVVVEACTDLATGNWEVVESITLSDGSAQFTEEGVEQGARFYRMRGL